MLLAAGANKDAARNDGATLMYVAAQSGHAEIPKMLLEAGANTDPAANGGFTPMYIAAQQGQVEVLKMVLAAGANKDAADNDCVTPMVMAAQNGYAEVLKMQNGYAEDVVPPQGAHVCRSRGAWPYGMPHRFGPQHRARA